MPKWVPTAPGLLVPEGLRGDSRWGSSEAGLWLPTGILPKREELPVKFDYVKNRKRPQPKNDVVGWVCYETIGIGLYNTKSAAEKQLADEDIPEPPPKLGYGWYYS